MHSIPAMTEAQRFQAVVKIIENHDHDPSRLIPILQAVQDEYRYLPEEILTYVAMALDISPAKVFGVATFFSHFSLEAKGKYVIKVCDGTACHVKGSGPLVDIIQKELKLDDKKKTTSDLLFTLETVSCLGACGLAPVMVVNEEVHGLMTQDKVCEIIKEIRNKEAAHA